MQNPVDIEAEQQFSKAKQLLSDILQSEKLVKELEEEINPDPRLVMEKRHTLALGHSASSGWVSLKEAVKSLLESIWIFFLRTIAESKRELFSPNSSANSKARQSIDLEVVQRFCNIVCNYLAHRAGPAFLGQRASLLSMALP